MNNFYPSAFTGATVLLFNNIARLVTFDFSLVGHSKLPKDKTAKLAPSFTSQSTAKKGPDMDHTVFYLGFMKSV